MKFRKKPVVIDAVQFTGTNPEHALIFDYVPESGRCTRHAFPVKENCHGEKRIEIQTLEGTMTADPGDWIVRGVKGEFYPVKPDIFAATYEPA